MHSEKIPVAGSGGTESTAVPDLPEGPPRAFALFAHRSGTAASRISGWAGSLTPI